MYMYRLRKRYNCPSKISEGDPENLILTCPPPLALLREKYENIE